MKAHRGMSEELWDVADWLGLTALGLYSSWWVSFKANVIFVNPEIEHLVRMFGGAVLFLMTLVMTVLRIEELLHKRKGRKNQKP